MTNVESAKTFLKSLTKLMEKHSVAIHVAGYEGETMYMMIGNDAFYLSEYKWQLDSFLCIQALARLGSK